MMRNLVEITINIPRELRGNENKLRNYLESKEEDIARKLNCFGASFKGVTILLFDKCSAIYSGLYRKLVRTKLVETNKLWSNILPFC